MPSNKVYLSAPIAKTVETEDGGREVWGFATLEVVDKSGEIADFDGTVKAFEKWSSEVEKRTNGKSKGNVRLMHGNTTAGKAIHWEPTETTIADEDGKDQTVKAIWTGAYIPPTKPDVIKDIDEGILSAFSIGGSYAKRWWDDTAKAFRFIPELSEYSLVDNPCVPGADIVNVIEKADGPWTKPEVQNMVKHALVEEITVHTPETVQICPHCQKSIGEKMLYNDGENWFHRSCMDKGPIFFEKKEGGDFVGNEVEKKAPKGSYEELSQRIEDACKEKFTGPYRSWWDGYVVATFADHVIVRDWDQDTYWDIPYTTIDDGSIQLGDTTEVEKIEEFVPIEAMKALEAEMEKRKAQKSAEKGGEDNEPKGDVNKTTDQKGSEKSVNPEDIAKAAEAAGLSLEQIQSFFKALTPIDQPTAPASVDVVDGDGDKDDNKEFPNPPEGKDKINIASGQAEVKAAEKEVGVGPEKSVETSLTKAFEALEALKSETGELAKAGKAISKKRQEHIDDAIGHLHAAKSGTEYGPEHHVAIASKDGEGGTGEEAPAVTEKALTSILNKSVGVFVSEEVSKVVGNFEALAKGLATGDALSKAMESFTKAVETVTTRLDDMEKMVKEIHETPQPGGPVLNGGSPDIAKMFSKSASAIDMSMLEEQALENFVKTTTDPIVRDRIGQELAIRRHKTALR